MIRITAIVPVRRDHFPAAVIDSIRQSAFHSDIEVIMAVGSSPSRQRNVAALSATGDWLYFLDDDSVLSRKTLLAVERATQLYPKAIIGGPAETRANASFMERVFGKAMGLYSASGPTRSRHGPTGQRRAVRGHELTLCNLLVPVTVFQRCGGFNENLYPGEDPEILARLRLSGSTLVYDPNILIQRPRRSTLGSFVRQFSSYGRARLTNLSAESPGARIAFLAPMLAIVYFGLSLIFLPLQWAAVPALLYLATACLETIFRFGKDSGVKELASIPLAACLMLAAYGTGMLQGIIRAGRKHLQNTEVRVERIVIASGCQQQSGSQQEGLHSSGGLERGESHNHGQRALDEDSPITC